MKRSEITSDYLKSILEYNPLTGAMYWKKRNKSMFESHERTGRGTISAETACSLWNKRWAGNKAGSVDAHGYIVIRIGSHQYKAHILAWIYMTGKHPNHFIDHIDGDPANTIWSNLREATRAENNSNVGPRKNNTLGVKGVRQRPSGKYEARLTSNGVVYQLGLFNTLEDAAAAHSKAAKEIHGEFARI